MTQQTAFANQALSHGDNFIRDSINDDIGANSPKAIQSTNKIVIVPERAVSNMKSRNKDQESVGEKSPPNGKPARLLKEIAASFSYIEEFPNGKVETLKTGTNDKNPTPDTTLLAPRMSMTGSIDSSKSRAVNSFFQSRKQTLNENNLQLERQKGSTISNGLSYN